MANYNAEPEVLPKEADLPHHTIPLSITETYVPVRNPLPKS